MPKTPYAVTTDAKDALCDHNTYAVTTDAKDALCDHNKLEPKQLFR